MAACPTCGRTTGPDLLLHHKPGCREAARWPADRVQPLLDVHPNTANAERFR